MTQITHIVNSLPEIQENLQTLKKSTNELRVNASQLNDGESLVENLNRKLIFMYFAFSIEKSKKRYVGHS